MTRTIMDPLQRGANRAQNKWLQFVIKGGVPFFWGFTLSLLYTSLWVTIPSVVSDVTGWYLQTAVCFIFIQSVLNWFLIARIRKLDFRFKVAGTRSDNPGDEHKDDTMKGEWKHCVQCDAMAPPRSHHCTLCNTCIPRRDHHCYFTGSCIGHTNQRRFIVLLLYLLLGSILGFTLNMLYIHLTLPFPSVYYLPVLFLYRYFVHGDLTLALLLIMVQGYMCMFTLVSAAGYLAVEVRLTILGMTQYESGRNITRYQGSVLQNIRTVFGPLWLLPINFLLPVAIPLPNNWEGHKEH